MAKQGSSRILRTFGSAFRNVDKKKRIKMRKAQEDYNKNKPLSIATEKSVRTIYIASGGMNKRY